MKKRKGKRGRELIRDGRRVNKGPKNKGLNKEIERKK